MAFYALGDVLSIAYELLRKPIPDAVKNADDYMPNAIKNPEIQDEEPLMHALAQDGWDVKAYTTPPKSVSAVIDQGLIQIKFTYEPLCNIPWFVWFFIYDHVDLAKRKCVYVFEVNFLSVKNHEPEPLGRAPITDSENLCAHLHASFFALRDAFAKQTT